MSWISKGVRKSIYKRDGNKCAYCDSKSHLSLDHFIPKSRGGELKNPANLVTSCVPCNLKKANH